jgi:hypothetical protein
LQLDFELLDGAGERRLRDPNLLGGASEVEMSRDRKKISDLVHFQRIAPGCAVSFAPRLHTLRGSR